MLRKGDPRTPETSSDESGDDDDDESLPKPSDYQVRIQNSLMQPLNVHFDFSKNSLFQKFIMNNNFIPDYSLRF